MSTILNFLFAVLLLSLIGQGKAIYINGNGNGRLFKVFSMLSSFVFVSIIACSNWSLNFLHVFDFEGHCQCSSGEFTVSQTQTGKTVGMQPEWKVTISNRCACSQSEVKLSCDGFQTVETIESSVLAKTGGECLINNGEPVAPFSEFSYNYAWHTWFPFSPLSSQVNCS